MFGKISKVLLGAVLIGGIMRVNCSEIAGLINIQCMLNNTRILADETSLYTETVKSVINDTSTVLPLEIQSGLVKEANTGNYLAQYYLAEYYGALAKDKQNGEKFVLEKQKAILLLVSAIKAGFWRSIDELKFALNGETQTQLDVLKNGNIPDIENLASDLARGGKL